MKQPLLLVVFWGLLWTAPEVSALTVVAKEEEPFISRKLPGQGLSATIVKSALERAGYPVTFAFETWPRAYEGAEIGVYDIVGSIWYTDERAREFEFSDPYLMHEIKFIKRKSDQDIKFDSLDDLDGLVVGTLQDYAYDDEFLKSRKFIKVPQNYLLQNLLKLSLGEIDLTLDEERKIRYQLNQFMKSSVKDLEFLPKPLIRRGTHIAVSRSHPEHEKIIDAFNRAIQAMKADGSYEKILREFRY
ncbi:MAG: transporter substrate-binding domain-containing protein [Methylococcaceae bacterium]|nr:transporter substrate-binding domain-containing protein [Methylococcaceae bacterium]MCI0733712.1 transporter substrate-binding domain-containing protein [Methylococcaceae bacterium]